MGALLWNLPLAVMIQKVWVNLVLATLLLTWLGYGLSRFLERAHQMHRSGHAALVETRQDSLTRVLGRAAIEAELNLALERTEANGSPLSLVVCFKAVNDRQGHAVGNEVLRGVAKLLRRSVGARAERNFYWWWRSPSPTPWSWPSSSGATSRSARWRGCASQ